MMEKFKIILPLVLGGIMAVIIPKDAIYQSLDKIFKSDETK